MLRSGGGCCGVVVSLARSLLLGRAIEGEQCLPRRGCRRSLPPRLAGRFHKHTLQETRCGAPVVDVRRDSRSENKTNLGCTIMIVDSFSIIIHHTIRSNKKYPNEISKIAD